MEKNYSYHKKNGEKTTVTTRRMEKNYITTRRMEKELYYHKRMEKEPYYHEKNPHRLDIRKYMAAYIYSGEKKYCRSIHATAVFE